MILTSDGMNLKELADKALAIVDEMAGRVQKIARTPERRMRISISTDADSLPCPSFFP